MIVRRFGRSGAELFARSTAIAAWTLTDNYRFCRVSSCFALIGFAGVASVALAEPEETPGRTRGAGKREWNVLSLEQRRRLFFKYEKRIREMSPQDKVFEYFASQRDELGQAYMLPGDMLRSVVPVYPPEESTIVRSGSLQGEPQPSAPEEDSAFFKDFDIDGNGRISYDEYLLFTTLISIPREDLQVAFKILDSDGSNTVDAKEFGDLLQILHEQAGCPADTNRSVSCMTKDKRAGLLLRFFGKDGKHQLTLDEFRSFITALKDELLRLEFVYYDFKHQGHISGHDFAHTIVGCASYRSIDEQLNKVNHLPQELATGQVDYEEFKCFREVLRCQRQLLLALEFIQKTKGRATQQDFHWVTENVLQTKVSALQVAILYSLFPGKDDQDVNLKGLHKVLNRHLTAGLNRMYNYEQHDNPHGFFDCIKDCLRKN